MSNTRRLGRATGPTAHTEEDPAVEATMSRDVINIPDNVLQKAIHAYSQEDQDDLQWLFSYATQELGKSRERLCDFLQSDWSTIFRVATGSYPASISNFMDKVRDMKRRVTATVSNADFVETMVSRKIFDVLDYALAGDINGGKIVLISGASRRGKSRIIQEWCRRNNHGKSVYVDMPESGGMRALLYEIASACRINKSRKTTDVRERIIESFHRRRILIIDEIARLTPPGRDVKLTEIEFLRRLHDTTGCAIALCATPVFEHMIDTSRMHDYFEQLVGRIAEPLKIPENIYREECRAFLKAFGADKTDASLLALTHQIANSTGKLGILFELLNQAAALAKATNAPLSHAHLSAAYKRRSNKFTWPTEDK